MKVLVTESQYKLILVESSRRKINIDLESIKSFAEGIVSKVQEDIGVQFRMLFTWGAAVGGVMRPLNDFIEKGDFSMSSFEKSLVLVATAAMIFHENKKTISKLLKAIQEKGLKDTFDKVLSKGQELKSTFIDFIQSLNAALYTMTNIMSYTFLIPLLPMLWEIGHSGFDKDDIKDIVTRLLAFGLTSVSGVTLKKLITKILERFR